MHYDNKYLRKIKPFKFMASQCFSILNHFENSRNKKKNKTGKKNWKS